MTFTDPKAGIRALRRQSFSALSQHGIDRTVSDDFERFLKRQGTLRRPSLVVRCQRITGEFTCRVVMDKPISRHRLDHAFLPFLRRLEHRSRGPCDFFALLSDNLYVAEASRSELLYFLKRVAFLRCDRCDEDEVSTSAILIPDYSLQDPGFANELTAIEQAARATAFDTRQGVIKWRGSLSGPDYPTIYNCDQFPRYRLLMLSLQHPDVIDARLTHYDNCAGSGPAEALRQRLEGLFGEPSAWLPATGFVPYKYLVSIDGAVSAWKRVPTILASGSVLLLQHRWSQFFYPGLQPWEHYVPLKPDLSDLLEHYAWLQANPGEARVVAERGRRFAADTLRPQVLEDFFVEVLDTCSALCT